MSITNDPDALKIYYETLAAIKKGPRKRKVKAKRDREDAKQLKGFRNEVWQREEDKLMGYWPHCPWQCDANVARCQHCGSLVRRGADVMLTGEVHHRISRRHKATRYDPDNGVLLCNHLLKNCHEKAERGEITV